MTDSAAPNMSKVSEEIGTYGVIHVPEDKAPRDLSKAIAMTQHSINNLGGPMFASKQDNDPDKVNESLNRALIDVSINRQGVLSMPAERAPADRAVNEAFTLMAIKKGDRRGSLTTIEKPQEGLTPEQQKELQEQAQAEKDRYAAARTFGGGDKDKIMPGIFTEIQKCGVIAVPAEKSENLGSSSMAHTKAMMEINAMKGEAIYASGTDGTPEDKTLEKAKMEIQLQKGATEALKKTSENRRKSVDMRATNEALTMLAIQAKKTAECD